MNIKKLILLIALALVIAPMAGVVSQAEEAPHAASGTSIYNLTSSWTTQGKKVIRLSAFEGHPVVMAMIYTSCTDACPMTVSDMKKIEKALPRDKRGDVRFVLASFDTKTDTPEKLEEYAKAHNLNAKTWSLLHGSEESVRELSAVLDIRYKKIRNASFSHSNVITILDAQGSIRHQQIGLDQNPKESLEILKNLL